MEECAEHRVKSPWCFHVGSDSAELAFWGLAVSDMRGYQPEPQPLTLLPVLCSLEGLRIWRVGWARGLLQPPGARTERLQHARLTVETADLGLVLAMLPWFWAHSLCFWFSSELGTCYLDTGTQSVGAPAGLPCALLPGIKESQSFAVPDSSVGMKHELRLKCENTVSATETNCTWCLGRHISCKLCQCPYLPCPLSCLNMALSFRMVG